MARDYSLTRQATSALLKIKIQKVIMTELGLDLLGVVRPNGPREENCRKVCLFAKKHVILHPLIVMELITYLLLTRTFSVNIYLSNAIAWIISVLFAFVTNKTLVFESKDKSGKTVTREIISFFACRIMSLGIDMASMYAMVTILKWNDFVGKIIANVIVIILNYVFSKLLVFRKKK